MGVHKAWMVFKCQLGYPNSGGETHDKRQLFSGTLDLREAAFFNTDIVYSCFLCTALPNTEQPDPCIPELKPWTKAACVHASTEYKRRTRGLTPRRMNGTD